MTESPGIKKSDIKILVVDDEQNIAKSIQLALVEYGYDTDICIRSEDALERIKSGHYQLVVCDIKMPGMNGLELLKAIKTYSRFIQVIMVTGYSSLQTALACMDEGADDFLFKPFKGLEELFKTVDLHNGKIQRWRWVVKQAGKVDILDKNNILS